MIAVHNVEAWTEQLGQAKESNKLVVIDFTATWCPPCRAIAPYFAELAKRFLNVVFLKVDVDELQSVAQDCKVDAMPTFIFMKEGQTVHKIIGADRNELEKKILQYA